MKKASLIILIAVIVILVSFFLLRPKSPMKSASEAEIRGDWVQANSGYIEALFDITGAKKLPDKNRAKFLEPKAWHDNVRKYLDWITMEPFGYPDGFANILEGIRRCSTHVENEHFFTNDSVIPLTMENLALSWDETFFPPNVLKKGDHTGLIEQAFEKKVSILKISSMRGYSYNGSLLSLTNYKRTDFFLYPESNVFLLTAPGKHLLICSGEVEFQDDKIWRSPYNIIPLVMPDSSSQKSIILKTMVKRGQ